MPDKSMAPRIYLAGPEVFVPDPLSIGKKKKDLCERYGFTGVFPFDAGVVSANQKKIEQGLQISQNNESLIRSCDLLIANMTPFRSPSMDVGTAFELGFARALGKPVFGYTNDERGFRDRASEHVERIDKRDDGRLEDSYGMEIEDFDLTDNLMIDGAIYASSKTWVVVPRETKKDYYSDLSGFETCLMFAGNLFKHGQIQRFSRTETV